MINGSRTKPTYFTIGLIFVSILLGACGSSSHSSPAIQNTSLILNVTDFGPLAGVIHSDGSASKYNYTVRTQPSLGSLVLNSDSGEFTYSPTSYAVATDVFEITISDETGNTGVATVSIERRSGIFGRPVNNSCIAPDRPSSVSPVKAVRVFSGIGQWDMISIYQYPDYPDIWYGIVKQGQIIRFENRENVNGSTIVLDISPRVVSESESGLIGLVFHPDFSQNGKLFIYWTGLGSPTISYLSEFTSLDGGLTLDPSTERVLLSLDHTTTHHKGGHMEFGPDGYLYLSIGDGGPFDQAQDVSNLFGTIIRIDPDNGDPYAIPADNPFANGGGRPEIFAWGFRNPWRWSFDKTTGDLWVGDVGRNSWEEIDIVQKGGNYGWPIREGAHCHPPEVATCNTAGLIDPIYEYPHTGGNTAIIGGVVYSGNLIPSLRGNYVFADIGRLVMSLESGLDGSYFATTLVDSGLSDRGIWSLSTDLDGEIYVVKPDGIFRLEPETQVATASTFPETLSETGCFNPANPVEPASGLVPYDITVPFWSNGAEKQRYLAIPDGTTIHIDSDGDWDLPVGSVLSKVFYFDDQPVETRLLVRHDNGNWAGYAYQWRADLSDADLISGAVSLEDQGISHTIPSRAQCLQCHVGAAGGSLGPENIQMNRFIDYPDSGLRANQLATLDAIGMFDIPLAEDPVDIDRMPETDNAEVDIVLRAKAYFHTNCSNCHRPNGPGRGPADFRYSLPHADMGTCNAPAETDDLGMPGLVLIAPGLPESSAVNIRVSQLGVAAMPPVGKQALDAPGTALLDEYVNSLTTCP